MLNVNAFVLLLCLELNSRRIDTAETNNFIVWPNDDIRTVAMSTENYGLAVACFQVYYGITKCTQYNILGNVELNWPKLKLFHTFSHILTSFFLNMCIHSIIPHQYM